MTPVCICTPFGERVREEVRLHALRCCLSKILAAFVVTGIAVGFNTSIEFKYSSHRFSTLV